MPKALIATLLFVVCAVGCGPTYAGFRPLLADTAGAPYLFDPERFCRLYPSALSISIAQAGARQSLRTYLECEPQQAVVLGFGTFDVPLFVLRWSSGELQYERNELYKPLLDPRTVLADLQLAFVDSGELASLEPFALRVEQESGMRKFFRGEIEQLRITRSVQEGRQTVRMTYSQQDVTVEAAVLKEIRE